MTPEQEKALKSVPSYLIPLFTRAFEGNSRASGVKAFCSACVGHVRKDVTNCTAKACPLYPYRPWQPGEPEDAE